MPRPSTPETQCTAKSKQTGHRCCAARVPGATVCRFHGGGAPQVRAAAKERIMEMVDPALQVLDKCLSGKKIPHQVALAAAKDVLDRAGLGGANKLELSGPDGGPLTLVARELSDADLEMIAAIAARNSAPAIEGEVVEAVSERVDEGKEQADVPDTEG